MKNPDMEYFRKPRKDATDQSRVEKLYRDPSAFKNELGAKPVMTNKPMPNKPGIKPVKRPTTMPIKTNKPMPRPTTKPIKPGTIKRGM